MDLVLPVVYDKKGRTLQMPFSLKARVKVGISSVSASSVPFWPFGTKSLKHNWPQALKPETYNSMTIVEFWFVGLMRCYA